MTSSLTCENCGKIFTRKSNYTSHMSRKTSCSDKKVLENNTNNISSDNDNSINYSPLSYLLTKKINKEIKKNNGIYFTPPTTINSCIEYLKPYMNSVQDILEPSCGSCEFVMALNRDYPDKNITGIEYNQTIYDAVKYLNEDKDTKINIIHFDFLKYDNEKKYDLIIGNPPYYVMSKKDVKKEYYQYFEGRPNIFILFIIKSISMLNDDGILSFVLPKNFMNCLYYDKTRKFIADNLKIINIIECGDKYIETSQETILIILQKKPENIQENSEFIISSINNYTIFGIKEHVKQIKDLYTDSTNLSEIGFKVSVGNVVWNQCKDILTDDTTKTRLIYSSDIKNNKLIIKKYSNDEKKNFINKSGIIYPTLVINRGYGVGEYNFEYCLIEGGFEYLVENHLICINYIGNKNIKEKQTIYLYKKIIESLEDERTKKFIQLYFGNNAINTTEMNNVLPIYLNTN